MSNKLLPYHMLPPLGVEFNMVQTSTVTEYKIIHLL